MPPRYQSTMLSFEEKLRNLADLGGQPGHRGHARIGATLNRSGLAQSLIQLPDAAGTGATGSAQLLVMSVTGDSIASGGDYLAFDTIVAQHGFRGVSSADGGAWVHPIGGVYALTYQDRWTGWDGAIAVQLELDGVLIPEGLIIGGDAEGDLGMGALLYAANAGSVGRLHVDHAAGSARTCSATVRIGITDPKSEDIAAAIGGTAVSLGTQASPDTASWSGIPAGWIDTSAHWIWHAALVDGDRPAGEEAWFQGFVEVAVEVAVTVEVACDNEGLLYLNGTLVSDIYTTRSTHAVTLQPGINQFNAYVLNENTAVADNPAGFIMSARTSGGAVLLRTTDAGGWYASPSQPAGWLNP